MTDQTPLTAGGPLMDDVTALRDALVDDEMRERLCLAVGDGSSMSEREFIARLDALIAAARASATPTPGARCPACPHVLTEHGPIGCEHVVATDRAGDVFCGCAVEP